MTSSAHLLINPRQLGTILLSARKAQRLTQAALAERVGMSQSRISWLEKNAAEISVGQLLQICTVLGLELTIGTRDQTQAAPPPGEDW